MSGSNGQTKAASPPLADTTDESVLLGRLLYDGRFAQQHAASIRPALFRDDGWRRAFGAVQRDLRDHGEVDPSSIRRALCEAGLSRRAVDERMVDLGDAAVLGDLSARQSLRRLDERRRCALLAQTAEQVRDGVGSSMTLAAAADLLREALDALDGGGLDPDGMTTLADALHAAEHHEQLISTGIDWLDNALPGRALAAGDKVAVAGPPGVGKTALAQQLALGALGADPELRVVWGAGEMTPRHLAQRALMTLSGLSSAVLQRPHADLSPLQAEGKAEAVQRLADLGQRFAVLPAPLAVERIESGVARTGARLVVVDYLQLVQPPQPGGSRREEIDHALRELVRVGQAHGAALLIVSNMPKGTTRGRDIFDAFKESGEIAYTADLAYVGELDAKDADVAGEDLPDEVDVRWRCLKARHGPPRSMLTRFQRWCCRFEGIA